MRAWRMCIFALVAVAGCGGSGSPSGGMPGGGNGGNGGGGNGGNGMNAVCGDGQCTPGEGPASCPADCGCALAVEHGVVGGMDVATGKQAHFWRGGEDLVDFECATRGSGGVALSSTWSSSPCVIRINGGFMTELPGATPSYCWSDGTTGVLYAKGANGYQPSPPDGTILVVNNGVPEVQNHLEGWDVTFSDEKTGSANTYTDAAGKPAWRRGATRFVRADGSWNSAWSDNVTWNSDPGLPAWSPLQYAGHTSTPGIGTGGFSAADVSTAGVKLHFDGDAPGTLSIQQVAGKNGGANGLLVSIAYDAVPGSATMAVETSYYDVVFSDGSAYSWNANTGIGEYLSDTDGASVYAGPSNTVLLAAAAQPPGAGNGWADPMIEQRGRFPLDAKGLTWSRNGQFVLSLGTDGKSNVAAVAAEGGTAWAGELDDLRRIKHSALSEGKTAVFTEDVVWDPGNGHKDSDTIASLGGTRVYTAKFDAGSEVPKTITTTANGMPTASVTPTFATADSGFPYLKDATYTTNTADAFGSNQPQSARFVFSFPSAGVVNIDESTRNVHLTYNLDGSGQMQSLTGSSPWVASAATTVGYAAGNVSSVKTTAQPTGGSSATVAITASLSALAASVERALTVGGAAIAGASASATWDGKNGLSLSILGNYFGLTASATASRAGATLTQKTDLSAPGMSAASSSGTTTTDASGKTTTTGSDTDDGDKATTSGSQQ